MKIFVGNLALDVSEEELNGLFAEHGNVSSVKIIRDNSNQMSRGFATFAPSALYAYATSVLSAVEIMQASRESILDEAMLERLIDLADYFATQADQARQIHGRIPD